MKQIRYGFFETNSSSVHGLILPNSATFKVPDTVKIVRQEDILWSTSTVQKFDSVETKISYALEKYLHDGRYDGANEFTFARWLGHMGVKTVIGSGYTITFDDTFDDSKFDDRSSYPFEEEFNSEEEAFKWIFTDDDVWSVEYDDSYGYPAELDSFDDSYDYYSHRDG